MPTDYYNTYRESLRSSLLCKNGDWGSFDPLILSVTLTEKIQLGLSLDDDVTKERLFGWGTYLHENMHWYQCIGTTYGLFRLLSSMAQTHNIFQYSRRINDAILEKPLYQIVVNHPPDNSEFRRNLNIAVNTWMDIEFTNAFFESPDRHVDRIAHDHFFGGLDHGSLIYLGESLGLLVSCFPNSEQAERFHQDSRIIIDHGLENAKNHDIFVPPVGASDIMESAARISEIQYLQHSSGRKYSWSIYKRMGYLESKYLKAFNTFLQITRLNIGNDPCSSAVNLFLITCDIALNPSHGYPNVLSSWKDFIKEWHPGFRFFCICSYLANRKKLINEVAINTESEYKEMINEICNAIGYETPECVAAKCDKMLTKCGAEILVNQVDTYESDMPNFPVQYVVGKHVKAMRVRQRKPLFLAMPANYVEGDRDHQEAIDRLMEILTPPFVRRDYTGIEPVLPRYTNIDDKNLKSFHSTFSKWLIMLSLGRQLAAKKGPFKFAHPWTDSTKSEGELRSFVEDDFLKASGHALSNIKVSD